MIRKLFGIALSFVLIALTGVMAAAQRIIHSVTYDPREKCSNCGWEEMQARGHKGSNRRYVCQNCGYVVEEYP